MNDFESRSPHWLGALGADEPLPLEVLDAIRVADREDGSAEQIARLEARLLPLFQPTPGAESLSPKAAGSAGSSVLSMLKLAGVGVALVGIAALVWPQREHVARHSVPGVVKRSVEVSAHEPAVLVRIAPLGGAASEPNPAAAMPEVAPTNNAPKPEASEAAHVERAGSVVPRSAVSRDTLALEARLLSRARRALETDAEQALKLAERHQQRFPHGLLSEEREAIAIKALRGAGKEALAAQRQARFLASYPESPHAMSLSAGARP